MLYITKTALLKNSIEPMLVNKVMEVVADYMPKLAKQKFTEILGAKIAGVVTNVPVSGNLASKVLVC